MNMLTHIFFLTNHDTYLIAAVSISSFFPSLLALSMNFQDTYYK